MRVRAGIFSLTAAAPPDDDGSYLRWHLLDHMPEQYQLPGIVHGLRWIADGDYPQHRLAAHGPLGQVGNAFLLSRRQSGLELVAQAGLFGEVGVVREGRTLSGPKIA